MGGLGPALCSAVLAAALLAGWLAALSAGQLVLLSLLAAALYMYIKVGSFVTYHLFPCEQGGAPLPLPLPENNPKWITGNAYYSGVSMVDNIRNFYNEMKHHR